MPIRVNQKTHRYRALNNINCTEVQYLYYVEHIKFIKKSPKSRYCYSAVCNYKKADMGLLSNTIFLNQSRGRVTYEVLPAADHN